MKNVKAEIVRDFNGCVCLNLMIDNETIMGIPEYTTYVAIKKYVVNKLGIKLPTLSQYSYNKIGRKEYGVIEYTI